MSIYTILIIVEIIQVNNDGLLINIAKFQRIMDIYFDPRQIRDTESFKLVIRSIDADCLEPPTITTVPKDVKISDSLKILPYEYTMWVEYKTASNDIFNFTVYFIEKYGASEYDRLLQI